MLAVTASCKFLWAVELVAQKEEENQLEHHSPLLPSRAREVCVGTGGKKLLQVGKESVISVVERWE